MISTDTRRMSYDELAEFLFIENKEFKNVSMSLDLPNSKELFFLCYDLFLKGLVLMFGEDNKVEIHKVTLDDFLELKKRLKCANIDCDLQVVSVETDPKEIPGISSQNFLNLLYIDNGPDKHSLRDYKFELQTPNSIYTIKFDITYNIPDHRVSLL